MNSKNICDEFTEETCKRIYQILLDSYLKGKINLDDSGIRARVDARKANISDDGNVGDNKVTDTSTNQKIP